MPVLYVPGQQKVQFELEAEPTTVLYMPAAQRAHRLELLAPMALLYDPAAHVVHVAGELAPRALLYVPVGNSQPAALNSRTAAGLHLGKPELQFVNWLSDAQ